MSFCICWEKGADGVPFNKESFGGFIEIRYHVRDVTFGDVVLCGCVKDLAELEFTHAAGGRWPQKIPLLYVTMSPSQLLLG